MPHRPPRRVERLRGGSTRSTTPLAARAPRRHAGRAAAVDPVAWYPVRGRAAAAPADRLLARAQRLGRGVRAAVRAAREPRLRRGRAAPRGPRDGAAAAGTERVEDVLFLLDRLPMGRLARGAGRQPARSAPSATRSAGAPPPRWRRRTPRARARHDGRRRRPREHRADPRAHADGRGGADTVDPPRAQRGVGAGDAAGDAACAARRAVRRSRRSAHSALVERRVAAHFAAYLRA